MTTLNEAIRTLELELHRLGIEQEQRLKTNCITLLN